MANPHPNIIYLNPDQMRADALACYGHPLARTPNFDRLAAEGVRFDQCHVQHTVCTPSRCSFMTGWYPHVRGHRTLWYPLQPDEPNTLRYLKQAGYEVHWAGKNDLLAAEAFADSVDVTHAWKWGGPAEELYKYGDAEYHTMLLGRGSEQLPDRQCYDAAINVLRTRRPDDPPLMLYVPTMYPHCPFTCPEPFYSMYDPDKLPPLRPSDLANKPIFHRLIRQYRGLDKVDESVLRKVGAVYLGMVSYVDHLVGNLLDVLDETGLAENTVIFAFSDHGEWAGDYGLVEKWQGGLDDCLTRVPMIVRAPGCAAGHVVREPIECFDILPTTLELAGVVCNHTHFARSMAAQLQGAAGDPERAVFAEGGYDPHETHCYEGVPGGFQDIGDDPRTLYYPKGLQQQERPESSVRCTMIRTAAHKLVFRPNDVSELYDLSIDPQELHNRYDDPRLADVRQHLEHQILKWYVHTSDVVPVERQPRGFPPGLPV